MSATGQITTIQPGVAVRVGEALIRWGRRRSVRADISPIYDGYEERRAELEEQLLLDREIRAFQQELDRAKTLRTLYRGL